MNTQQSFTDIESFLAKWKKEPLKGMRMGQYFCCAFNITDSKLFYEANDGIAEKMIHMDHCDITDGEDNSWENIDIHPEY